MTAAEIIAWLRKDNKKRIVLIEIDYMYQVGVSALAVPTKGTLYFSNFAYTDESVSPPRRYQAAVKEAPEYERSLDQTTLRGKYNVNISPTVLNNADGEFDYILDLALDGSEHRVYVGDETWVRSDFVHLFTALSLKAEASPKKAVKIEVRDPGLLINKSIGGMTVVGGSEPAANKFRPLVFGFVHQLEPILYDVATSKYVFADTGTNTSIVAVRNDGVDVTGTATDHGDGTFSLGTPPTANEKITCDVLSGVGVAYRTSDAFDFLVGNRAGLTTLGRYTGAGVGVDLGGAGDYHVGIAIEDKRNVIDVCNDLCNSQNWFWAFTRLGSFYYGEMRPDALSFYLSNIPTHPATLVADIGEDDVRGDPAISHNLPTYAAYQAYGNVNWSQQATFSSSLDATAREQYVRKGYITPAFTGEEPTSTAYRGDVVSWLGGAPQLYHLSLSDSQLVETLISGPDDTTGIDMSEVPPQSVDLHLQNWASVRRSQNLPWVEFVEIVVGLDLYIAELGDIVNFTFPRFGFDTGKLAQVYKIRVNAMKSTIELGLVRRRFADVAVAPNTGESFELREDGGFELREDGGFEERE